MPHRPASEAARPGRRRDQSRFDPSDYAMPLRILGAALVVAAIPNPSLTPHRWIAPRSTGYAFTAPAFRPPPVDPPTQEITPPAELEKTDPETASPVQPTLRRAHDRLMVGDYKQAMAYYEALLEDSNKRIDAAVGLARCHRIVGRYEQALNVLRSVEQNDPAADQSAEWHLALAQVFNIQGRDKEVLSHTQKAVALNHDFAAARLLHAQTLERLGRRDQAIDAYRWFDRQLTTKPDLPRDPRWITNTAVGFLRYSELTQTNLIRRTQHVLADMLQVVYERLDRTWWPARLAAADLLRDRFNNDEHDGSVSDYTAALRINEHLPAAYVGLGEVALEDWNFEEVERRAQQALDVNPNYPPAIHLLAKKLVRERRYRQAGDRCEDALSVNARDVIAISIQAAAAACRFDRAEVERLRQKVEAINPRCARFYTTMGEALSGIRQYADSEQAFLQAIEYDPVDPNARTELGMMYMQWGREDKARNALEAAWVLDSYNKRTKFTLDLLDSLERFDHFESEHFVVRYDEDHDPGFGEYVAKYLEDIYPAVTADYGTALDHKTIIEFFPTHRAFAVRITGNPWIHTVGACTGRVIALASPRESTDLMGPYNFARVLKHEFTHTVTLAATNNRIPHWFTEGLAVLQEDAPRSFEWRQLLADATRRDRLFTLRSIDWGFIRPRRPSDRPLAYAQSEWMCQYIIGRFGYDAIDAMLKRYRAGQTQEEVLEQQLGISYSAFDHDFRAWASKQVARWGYDLTAPEDPEKLRTLAQEKPDDASIMGRLARAAFDAGDYESALQSARRAIKLDPSEPRGLTVLVKVLGLQIEATESVTAKRTYEDEALPAVHRLMKLDPDNRVAPRLLGMIHLRREEWDQAIAALKQLQQVCPADPTSWRGLGGIYLEQGKDDLALQQLLELARLDENNAAVRAQIGRIYRRRGRIHDARYWLQQALFIAPFDPDLHDLLGDTNMQAGDTEGALREYKMLSKLQPEKAEPLAKAAFAAQKLGEHDKAVEFARQAVKIDAQSDARALLPQ